MRINTHTYEQTIRTPPLPQGTTPTPNQPGSGPAPGLAPQKSLPTRLSSDHQGGSEDGHQVCAQRTGASGPGHDGQSPQGPQTTATALGGYLAPAPTAPPD